jgi:hypothetical protein
MDEDVFNPNPSGIREPLLGIVDSILWRYMFLGHGDSDRDPRSGQNKAGSNKSRN